MIVKRKDLPDKIQELIEAEESKYGQRQPYPRTVAVRIVDVADIHPSWHDANYRTIYAVDLERGVLGGVSGSSASEMVSMVSRAATQGGKQQLTNNQAIVVFNTYPVSVEVYLHHTNVRKELLPSGPAPLTVDEWLVLRTTQAFISSYRRECFRKIPGCDEIISGLQEKKYLDKRGALTFEGKRVIETMTREIRVDVGKRADEFGFIIN